MLKIFTVFLFLAAFAKNSLAAEMSFSKACKANYAALVLAKNLKTSEEKILFSKSAENIIYPASLVKLMTLYLTFEAIEAGKISAETDITVSERGQEISAVNKVNTLRLKVGDKISVKEAMRAVIVKSFNEAAVSLAEIVSGNEWEFAANMNKKAQELQMFNSSFRNASGLHEEGQFTTAYDLLKLTMALHRDFGDYYHLFALKEFDYHGRKFETHNHVLLEYKQSEGIKTGFTNASGFNLISAAKNENWRIFSVVTGCENVKRRDDFTKEIFKKSFEILEQKSE